MRWNVTVRIVIKDKNIILHQEAFDDFFDWNIVNKTVFKKIYKLVKDIRRNLFEGKVSLSH